MPLSDMTISSAAAIDSDRSPQQGARGPRGPLCPDSGAATWVTGGVTASVKVELGRRSRGGACYALSQALRGNEALVARS